MSYDAIVSFHEYNPLTPARPAYCTLNADLHRCPAVGVGTSVHTTDGASRSLQDPFAGGTNVSYTSIVPYL